MSEPNYKESLTGVFGHPVAENPTGVMQNAAFRELGLNWRYLNIEVLPEDLENAVLGLRAMDFGGMNCTVPHKVAVIPFLDELSPEAELMGAVNTIVRRGDRLIGTNTDGKGFVQSLRQDAGLDLAGKRVVILGAGGAARAMSVELALNGAASIVIVNRTEERARPLVELLNSRTPVHAEFVPWSGAYKAPADTDILANATSIGLFPNVNDKPNLDYDTITAQMVVCDVIPNPPSTPFLHEAAKRGARTLDGLGMLVYQGAIGFTLWTGHDAPVDVMKSALMHEFGIA